MARKCTISNDVANKIVNNIQAIQMGGMINNTSNAQIKQQVISYLRGLSDEYSTSDKAIKRLKEKLEKLGILADPSIFPVGEMETIIKDGKNAEFTVNNDNSTAKLEEADRNRSIKEAKNDFLIKAYGTATEVRQAAEHSAAIALFNKIVIDRENNEKVEGEDAINDNLRHYQQELLSIIKDYIIEKNRKSGTNSDAWDDIQIYEDTNGILTYTGKIHELEPEIMKALSHDNFPDEVLNDYFVDTKDAYKQKALKAYNAWQILSHFDTFVQLRYGKSLEIHNFGDMYFTGENKYRKANKGANNKTTWRTTEEIILSDEIDKIVQEMIVTTPMYSYGSEVPMTDAYLTFNSFCQVIGKLKDMGWKAGNVKFDFDNFNSPAEEAEAQLSDRSMEVLAGESIQSAINRIRENPTKYLSAIFEALSNKYWYSKLSESGILSDFNKEEKDVIYTIHKGLTGTNNQHSIASIDNSLFGQLAQAADSIFTVKFLQYYTGLDDETKVRSMSDDRLDGIIRSIKQSITTKNSKLNPEHYVVHSDGTATLRGNIEITPNRKTGGKLDSIVIKIPNTKIEATVTIDGRVTFKRNSKAFNTFSKAETQNFSELCDFVTEITGQNINSQIIELMSNKNTKGQVEANSFNETEKNLVSLACRTVFLSYVSNSDFGNINSKSQLKKKIRGVFGSQPISINTNMREIDLVHSSDIYTITSLANAIAISRGLYASSVIKSGDGSSYSVQSLSRLIGSMRQQMELQNKQSDSASNHLLILDPGVFKGVYTAREYYDLTRSTDHTDFSVKEFGSAMFMQDFIGGLCNNGDQFNPLIGNGVISILPSVNSDKNTIGRIIIDTRKTVNIDGKDIQIRNLTIPQFEQFICSELGQLYKKILLRTDEDWRKLMTFAGDRILSKPQSRLSLNGENQAGKYNNEWFFTQLNNECALKTKYIDPVSGIESYLSWNELVALNPDAESYEFLGKIYNKGEKPKVLYDTANVVNNLIKEYNLANRDAPISFTDQVHFIEEKDGSISTNSVLQGYQERFSSPEKLHEFFQNKNADILGTLLRNNFKVDLTDDSRQSRYVLQYFEKYKNDTGVEWVNQKEGEMIIGKISLGDENNPILVKDIRAKHHLDNFYFDLRTDKYEETETKSKSKSKKKAEPKAIFKSPLSRINEMLDSGLEEDGETSLTLERRNKLEHIKEAITHKQLLYEPQYLIDLKEFGVNFELNPLIDQYNHLDYLFSQEFMASTVGSLIAHPAKGALNNSLEAQEAARFNAQHKRNVSYTAAMQEFALNLLDGIPSDYNIAVVKDVYDLVGNVTGNEDSVKPYDGATFVNPFIVHLENNSLGAAKAGITKKQFVHFYDEHTATGGIIKTCGFGLTNDWMRNSPRLQTMMRKMTNGVWINKFRNNAGAIVEAQVDITHNYKGQEIGYDPIYFRKNGKYYSITSIENSGNNYYNIKGVEVNVDTKPGQLQARYEGESDQEINLNSLFNESGNPQDAVLINNNYKLWEVFGGKESLDLVEGQLIPSETSITNVVKAMNSVGVDPRTGRTYDAKNDASTISEIRTQEDIYQPLKHSDIHYIATEGAVKQGAANINKADLFDGDEPLNFMRIHMYQAGIQLDKEHHADNSELSLMTQVVNACAHLGYSLTESLSMFNALRSITDTDTAVLLDPIKDYVDTNNATTKTAAREAIVNTVLKAISKQTLQDNDLLRVFADDLITKLKEGGVLKSQDFESKLPIDNPGIYSKFMSSISVFLTKAGIKMKIPGILSVLTPSYEIMRTYQIPVVGEDGTITFRTCKWEQVESYAAQAGQSVQEYLDSIQDVASPTLTVKDVDLLNDSQTINRSNLRIGRSYIIRTLNGPEQVIKLDSPKKYKTWKKRIFEDPNVVYVAEDVRQGRELGTYDVEFEGYSGDDIQEYSLYDLDSIQRLYDLKDVLDSKDNEQIANFVGSLGERFVSFIDVDKGTIDIKGVERLLRQDTRHDLAAFSKNGGNFFEDLKDPQQIFVKINGENVRINLSTIKKHAYEIVLPKIFINEFGLETNDQLDEIENDPQFFSRRLAQKFTQGLKSSEYDIALKNISGKHWYLSENIGLNQEGLQRVEIQKFAEDDKLYWINPSTGDQICELYSDLDEVYRDSQGNYVIIPGEDSSKNISQEEGFKHYIQTLNYSTLQISDDSHVDDDLFKEYVDLIEQCDNKAARWYIRYLKRNNVTAFDLAQNGKTNAELAAQAESDNLKSMRANNTSLSQYTEDALLDPKQADNPITQRLIELGYEIHSSFMKSLEVVASRTPSQSMQSFMPMRVVAFDNPNLNTAHVSTMQIWLQGSDY